MEDQKNEGKMTPEEFTKEMKKLEEGYYDDVELFHFYADRMMADLLAELGYGEGVKIFLDQPKWYA